MEKSKSSISNHPPKRVTKKNTRRYVYLYSNILSIISMIFLLVHIYRISDRASQYKDSLNSLKGQYESNLKKISVLDEEISSLYVSFSDPTLTEMFIDSLDNTGSGVFIYKNKKNVKKKKNNFLLNKVIKEQNRLNDRILLAESFLNDKSTRTYKFNTYDSHQFDLDNNQNLANSGRNSSSPIQALNNSLNISFAIREELPYVYFPEVSFEYNSNKPSYVTTRNAQINEGKLRVDDMNKIVNNLRLIYLQRNSNIEILKRVLAEPHGNFTNIINLLNANRLLFNDASVLLSTLEVIKEYGLQKGYKDYVLFTLDDSTQKRIAIAAVQKSFLADRLESE